MINITLLSKNLKTFIKKSNKKHNFYYDYSLVIYKGSLIPIKIICPKHGEFKQKPKQHFLQQGCPSCNSSKGEIIIENYLKNSGINYLIQKTFQDCRNKRLLPFDFYLPDFNLIIEYQGDQHYKPIKIFGGNDAFIRIQQNDKIKKEYCITHGIKFIELNKDNINELQTIIRINK
jgi:Zn finger protein HypA/HybF involved in hydrogenase expression